MSHLAVTDIHKPTDQPVMPLGYAVFWRLGGAKVVHSTLQSLLASTGLMAYLPALPTPYTALRRAVGAWSQTFSGGASWLVRTVSKRPLVLAVVQEEVRQGGFDLFHSIQMRVLYDADHQSLFCTRTATGPITAQSNELALSNALQSFFQMACQTHEGADLSRMVRLMIADMHAIQLQRGVYFVEAGYRAQLQHVDTLMQALPEGSPLLVTLERIDDLKTRQHLSRTIHTDFLRALQVQQEAMKQVLSSNAPPTLKAVTARLASFRALANKARIYAGLLAERGEEITQQIASLQEQAQSLILVSAENLMDSENI